MKKARDIFDFMFYGDDSNTLTGVSNGFSSGNFRRMKDSIGEYIYFSDSKLYLNDIEIDQI